MIKLWKYRTLGSAFLLVDNRDGSFNDIATDTRLKKRLCNMDFGIGATGIIEIKNHDKHLFELTHHVATGDVGVACGSGSRCACAFVKDIGLVEDGETFYFQSYEGKRTAKIVGNYVSTSMSDDCKIVTKYDKNNYHVDPKLHAHVRFVESGFEDYDIVGEGMKVTGMEEYKSIFPPPSFMLAKIKQEEQGLSVRSFDRVTNVHLEVFANGTGETSVAMAYMDKMGLTGKYTIPIQWRDGETSVTLTRNANGTYSDVVLSGEAICIFDVTLDVAKLRKTFGA